MLTYLQETITGQTGPSNFRIATACWHRACAASRAEGPRHRPPRGSPQLDTRGSQCAQPPTEQQEVVLRHLSSGTLSFQKTLEKPSFPENPSKINPLLSLVPLQMPSPVLYKLYTL